MCNSNSLTLNLCWWNLCALGLWLLCVNISSLGSKLRDAHCPASRQGTAYDAQTRRSVCACLVYNYCIPIDADTRMCFKVSMHMHFVVSVRHVLSQIDIHLIIQMIMMKRNHEINRQLGKVHWNGKKVPIAADQTSVLVQSIVIIIMQAGIWMICSVKAFKLKAIF